MFVNQNGVPDADNCTDTATDSTDLLRDRDGAMRNEPGIFL